MILNILTEKLYIKYTSINEERNTYKNKKLFFKIKINTNINKTTTKHKHKHKERRC